jgi:hypothetical protein
MFRRPKAICRVVYNRPEFNLKTIGFRFASTNVRALISSRCPAEHLDAALGNVLIDLNHLKPPGSGVEIVCYARARTRLAVKARVRSLTRAPLLLASSIHVIQACFCCFQRCRSLILCPVRWKCFVGKSGDDDVGRRTCSLDERLSRFERVN